MNISVKSRSKVGTAAAKQARREGMVPATVYGKDFKPVSILMEAKTVDSLLRTKGRNAVFNVELDGRTQQVMFAEVSRDFMKGQLLNVELRALTKGQKVRVQVPVVLLNEDKVQVGVVSLVMADVEVEAEADKVPQELTVDVSGMEIGDVHRVADLKLPEGCRVLSHEEEPVVVVSAPAEEEPAAEVTETTDAAAPAEAKPEA
ncbi:50S ribosomal protein L25 [Oscillospiraceae bacterium HV4-5-C5C]|nr:50S ribosomal protein L25 [Oscillospiraceae bacterium HV4-5-C5C]